MQLFQFYLVYNYFRMLEIIFLEYSIMVFLYCLIIFSFLVQKIQNLNFSLLLSISPIFFLIDFLFLTQNINQRGYFHYYQETRYQYLSGYYFFNLMYLIMFFIIYKKKTHEKQKTFPT